MGILRNPKHEAYANAIASGKSQAESYICAGFKGNTRNAWALSERPEIVDRVEELIATRDKMNARTLAIAADTAGVDKAYVLNSLRLVADRCMQAVEMKDNKGNGLGIFTFNATGANRALELLGKELGMFIERKDVRVQSISTMSVDQLRAMMLELKAESAIDHQAAPPLPAPTIET